MAVFLSRSRGAAVVVGGRELVDTGIKCIPGLPVLATHQYMITKHINIVSFWFDILQ